MRSPLAPTFARRHLGVIRIGAAYALALDVTIARRALRRLTGAETPTTDACPGASTSPDRPLVVNRVDDPNGRMRLLGARGRLDEQTVVQLALALGEMPPGGRLHLDLTDAELSCVHTLRQLERTVDELELRGVRVRIVGVDPEHPALVPPSRR